MFSPKTAHTAKDNNTPSVFKPKNGSDLFVQPKVKVGQPGDKYEVEADQVADQVVNKQQQGAASNITATPASVQTMSEDEQIQEKPIAERIQPLTHLSGTSPLQRMEEEEPVQLQEKEEVQMMSEEDVQMQEEEEVQMMSEEDVQMQEEEEVQMMSEEDVQLQEEEEVQARENPGNTGLNTPSSIGRSIRNTRGQGSPLPGGVQSQMESGFGADFSGVRIHTGSESVAMNQTLGAQAFTNGNDIHFNQNRFNPATTEGQTLLAHELTHTIQQGASGPATQNESTTTNNGGSQASSEATEEPSVIPVAEATELVEALPLEGEVSAEQGTQEAGVAGEEVQPTTPRSSEEDPNFQQLEQRVENRAEEQQDHEPATASAGSAQAAAVSPPNERTGGAQAAQVDSMEEQEAGTFSAEAFKAQLMQRIESMQLPANEEEAADFENNNNIDEVRDAATQDVQSEQTAASGDIAATTAQEPNTDAIPEREVTALPPAPIGGAPNGVRAQNAMPPARGEAEVSQPLQDNMSEVDQQMTENEITDEQLANSNEPEFVGALDATNDAREDTAQAPGQFRTEEQGVLQGAQNTAENNSQQTLEGMHQDRAGLLNQVEGQQVQTGTTDTAERERIAGEINTIYENTKTDVETILSDLDTRVSDLFTAGAERAKQAFEDYVERKMDAYLDERYGGFSGFLNRVGDVFTGLPDEVNQFFVDGRQVFIDRMDSVITNIADVVATELTAAKDRITRGKQEVQDYVTTLPQNLQDIGREAAEGIQERFDELEQSVDDKQDELIDSLANQYNESLQEVDARIEEMQAANRGLIDMALDAIGGVIQTIINIKNMLTELLSSALSVIATIVQDPIGFLGLLIEGVGQGLNNFVSNILTHMQEGLIAWLTGSLGGVGITIPDNLFSLSGIFNLVAQILGISWDFVRNIAVRVLGEPVVRVVETAFEIFTILRNDGIAGLWEYIKEQFNNLKEMVMDAIRDMIISKVVEAGIKWILGLLNPAGAFIKAAMLIIDIVKFFIQRGSQIIEMVRAFIDGVKAVASGNVSAIASAIENALKKSIPVLIGFLASLLGITGLTQKVQEIIQKIRKKIEDAVVGLLNRVKNAAKRLFRRLTGRNRDQQNEDIASGNLEDTEVGEVVQFNGGGEGHRLWIDTQGPGVEVMVASQTKTVGEKLTEWENRKSEFGNTDEGRAKQEDAQGKIDRARSLYRETKTQGEDTEEKLNTAQNSTDEQASRQASESDQRLEDKENDLAQVLRELFEMYGDAEEYGPLPIVGTHTVPRSASHPEGEPYESHHVPENQFSAEVSGLYERFGSMLSGIEGLEDIGSRATARSQQINSSYSNGNNLPAILVHQRTHRTSRQGIHRSATARAALPVIEQQARDAGVKRVLMFTKSGSNIRASISSGSWRSFLRKIYQIERGEVTDTQVNLQESPDELIIRVNNPNNDALDQITNSLQAELISTISDEELDAEDLIEVAEFVRDTINRTMATSFSEALDTSIVFVTEALSQSDLDGDKALHGPIISELRNRSRSIWMGGASPLTGGI
ncbi:eCIS core domain-containing protein [Aquimarina spongiae]|uniref:eCIS core domain-containing protein n=1 Tax=Aquimarina spongiae TaxID=570521 RepID=A0A1M6IW09_9FLAO|nr:DUF4157 domain-containing protein [Aquimarina spongiae]SHJ38608.1 protein of unknown function [Aquimarina spongiae]